MGDINIRFRFNTTTGKKEIVVEYDADDDALPVEHEQRHRRIVEALVGKGILKPDETGNVKVERLRPDGTPEPQRPTPNDGRKVTG